MQIPIKDKRGKQHPKRDSWIFYKNFISSILVLSHFCFLVGGGAVLQKIVLFRILFEIPWFLTFPLDIFKKRFLTFKEKFIIENHTKEMKEIHVELRKTINTQEKRSDHRSVFYNTWYWKGQDVKQQPIRKQGQTSQSEKAL